MDMIMAGSIVVILVLASLSYYVSCYFEELRKYMDENR